MFKFNSLIIFFLTQAELKLIVELVYLFNMFIYILNELRACSRVTQLTYSFHLQSKCGDCLIYIYIYI
jgi:hypothetical protein